MFVVAVFASGLHGKTNSDIHTECLVHNNTQGADIFPNNTDLVRADIYKGGVFLGCFFGNDLCAMKISFSLSSTNINVQFFFMYIGPAAMYIWAIGILAAGQSSTMTGTYAGQFAMEGFLNLQWKKWQRVLLTRSVAILPTFFVAYYQEIKNLSGMNDLLNCLMALMIPFALIPTIAFSSNPKIMHSFASGTLSKVFSLALSLLVIGINIFFVFQYVVSLGFTSWYFILFIVILGLLYLLFCGYLVIDMAINMGAVGILNTPFGRLFANPDETYEVHQEAEAIIYDEN